MAKILVIDDNDTNRKLVVTLLNFQGHRTFEAIDGADGLASARVELPDLVISDILMPTMDGYEFVRQLRGDVKLGATADGFSVAGPELGYSADRAAAGEIQVCQPTQGGP